MPFPVSINEVCINCGEMMVVLKNGAQVYLRNSDAYLSCDIKQCPKCKAKIAAGLAKIAVEKENFSVIPTACVEIDL